jgi:magnesium chelatase family protein
MSRVRSVAIVGVAGRIVDVEVDHSQGLPGFCLVGLPDAAVSESRDRVRAAVLNSGLPWPTQRVTVNLSPADLQKRGSGFDLALACALLLVQRRIPEQSLAGAVVLGELGLDGSVRAVPGVVPAVLAARDAGYKRVVVAAASGGQAALVPDVSVLAVSDLKQLCAVLRGEAPSPTPAALATAADSPVPDLGDVVGQAEARLALEVAAAGGHHLYLHGPPGSGKTLLVSRLPGVLPELSDAEALEVTSIRSVLGLLPADVGLIRRPPFVAPHHSASVPAVIGGGSGLPRPGAASLAHRGVLFLDEAPEFRSGVLDSLRQPLESGELLVSRSAGSVRLPARFQLALAANPCPCGRFGSPKLACECTPLQIRRYSSRLSGPVLDRIDLRVGVRPVRPTDLEQSAGTETSSIVAARVAGARQAAQERWGQRWSVNAHVPGAALRSRWRPDPSAMAAVTRELDAGRLSARGLDRVLRVSWTLADLSGRVAPTAPDLAAALRFRGVSGAAA